MRRGMDWWLGLAVAGAVVGMILIVVEALTVGLGDEAPLPIPPDEPVAAPEQPPTVEPDLLAPPDVIAVVNKAGCGNCHLITGVPGAEGEVGPSLASIGVDAGTRRGGYTADEYITESILDPDAFIAPACHTGPCPSGVMLPTFGEVLTETELATIVAYLLVLGTDQESDVLVAAGEVEPLVLELPAESVLDPFQPFPGERPSDDQIALGRYLFYDPRLSANNSVSCASCHRPTAMFTDDMALSEGFPSTRLFRNTPTLYNTVYAPFLYWDGRMDGGDLPTLVRDHLTEAHFMAVDGRLMVERINQIPSYVEGFGEVYGGEPSFGRVLGSIAAYVQSLNTTATPYDRSLEGDEQALSPEAAAGLELFEGVAGCAECHVGLMLTNYEFANTGVGTDPAILDDPERHVTFRRFFRTLGVSEYRSLTEDVGLYALTFDLDDWGRFRTPSLREVARTGPYMHDGSLETLTEVVRFYAAGGGPTQTAGLEPLPLDDRQIDQIVAFLESLSSELASPSPPPDLPDYGLVPLGSG